jgi:hypothetical protein
VVNRGVSKARRVNTSKRLRSVPGFDVLSKQWVIERIGLVGGQSVVLLDGPEGHLKALGRAVLVVEKGARQLATGTRD